MRSFLLLSPGLLDAEILPFCSVGVAFPWSRSDSPKHVLVFPQSPFFGDFQRCESFAGPHISCHLPKVFVILQGMSVNWESLSACFPGWYLCWRNVPVWDLLANDFFFGKHLWCIQCALPKEETTWQTLLLFLVFSHSVPP